MNLVLLIALVTTATLADETALLKRFAISNNQFTSELYKKVTEYYDVNILVCPLSLQTLLTILHSGAVGSSAEQISQSLHLPESSKEIQETYQVLSRHFESTPYYNLTSDNMILHDNKVGIEENFKDVITNVFNTELPKIDYSKKKQVANEFNNWIEEKTGNTIKDVIYSGTLRRDGAALIVNTMFFRGQLANPFPKENTRKRFFWSENQDGIKTDMMEQTSHFALYKNPELNATFLKLGYAGAEDSINLVIVLPDDKDGLSALEDHIEDVFRPIEASTQEVHVVIPKFTMIASFELKYMLRSMGIRNIFEITRDLQGLFGEPLKATTFYQKVLFEVHEETSTASAATSPHQFNLKPAFYGDARPVVREPPQPHQFIADHPFIFYLTIKDVVVFAGRYSYPVVAYVS